MNSEISKSIQIICDEKGLVYDTVIEALESALAAAYRKDFGNRGQNIKVKFDVETGDIQAWDVKEVVEDIDEEKLEKDQEELSRRREVAREEERELTEEEIEDLVQFNPKTQIMISEAKEHDKKAKVGDTLEIVLEVPGDFGRMAAQTAKQVIMQKLREAERNTVFEDFKGRENQIVQGTVQRRDRSGAFIIELGKITGILPIEEQIQREFYKPGARMKFYVQSVEMGSRGPEIILSRASKSIIEEIFRQEIPEIEDGTVIIEDIARDPGNRSKISVSTEDESIDPIGSCIGQRGSRITTIIDELGGEKIDVIQYNKDAKEYIKQALSPAKISSVETDEETKEAVATVEPDQFSLAIGRGGQNVRLAADLTGWTIKVVQIGGEDVEVSSEDLPSEEDENKKAEPAGEVPTKVGKEKPEGTPAEESEETTEDKKEQEEVKENEAEEKTEETESPSTDAQDKKE